MQGPTIGLSCGSLFIAFEVISFYSPFYALYCVMSCLLEDKATFKLGGKDTSCYFWGSIFQFEFNILPMCITVDLLSCIFEFASVI